VGAVDISKTLRLSIASTSRSYLLSFTGAFDSELVRISFDFDIWSHDLRVGLIS
jgi:hypothetical protein